MHIKNGLIFIILFFAFLLSSCSEERAVKTYDNALIIGHRATGVGVNDGFIENTLPGIIEVLKYVDGAEVDIQMSSSKTLWVFHDGLFTHLDKNSQALVDSGNYYCVLQTPDSILEKLKINRDGVVDRLYKLEEVFEVFSKSKEKILTLDIKGYFESECVENSNVDHQYQKELAEALYELAIKYDIKNQIIAETVYTPIFERLKQLDETFQCYYLVIDKLNEKIDLAHSKNLDGLSINLHDSTVNSEIINQAREKGLTVKFWNILSEESLTLAESYKPYVIEISNLELIRKQGE
ncbi:glycerophosphodiester phosphodiesterase [Brumimicrobium oceani]|uniref:GP-PDE domain-containing protein n=1 Tax=Brumimicrobium oceani TaxID=2100725 RepID=A0A2U2XBS0_9FLAO|nr:glycerophosphodiester phosphodiesterase family protein [Brumimicrobium oceani]PWH85246.1 hypothetical protein DIT68_09925 [Brumimicrobium oceani]